VSASGNSLVAETQRGGAAPVRAEGRVAQRGSTVVEALRWAPVALRWSCDVRRERGRICQPRKKWSEGAVYRRKGR
jgi:hypothetical protein